ncbi:unnamed protein product, partial [Rangifer tarandus platyrhynchus]
MLQATSGICCLKVWKNYLSQTWMHPLRGFGLTLKDPPDWTKASGALPKKLLAWKISSFSPSIALNLLNTWQQSQKDVSPSDPRT